jgi:hypothetical protein
VRANDVQVLQPSQHFDDPTDVLKAVLAVTTLGVSAILWTQRRCAEAL